MWVQSLGREDPLEKEMAAHFSPLAWRIPWTEELGDYSPQGCRELDKTERLSCTSGKGGHSRLTPSVLWVPTWRGC